jgi:hypothetical protein
MITMGALLMRWKHGEHSSGEAFVTHLIGGPATLRATYPALPSASIAASRS